MKCYKIKDAQQGKQYTADLAPKLTHDFRARAGRPHHRWRVAEGLSDPGSSQVLLHRGRSAERPRREPAIQPCAVDRRRPRARRASLLQADVSVGPAEGPSDHRRVRHADDHAPRAHAATSARRSRDSSRRTRDAASPGTASAAVRVLRARPASRPRPADCGCVPQGQACASSVVCQEGFCGGVWETCVSLPIGSCGCSHP